ncbi:hypothetical protein V8F06_003593 [Rhypophila decipiens]
MAILFPVFFLISTLISYLGLPLLTSSPERSPVRFPFPLHRSRRQCGRKSNNPTRNQTRKGHATLSSSSRRWGRGRCQELDQVPGFVITTVVVLIIPLVGLSDLLT